MLLQAHAHEVFGLPRCVLDVLRFYLRDAAVLTVQTAQVAARAGYRQTLCARMEVVEWLLLHRIHGESAGLSIAHRPQLAVMEHA